MSMTGYDIAIHWCKIVARHSLEDDVKLMKLGSDEGLTMSCLDATRSLQRIGATAYDVNCTPGQTVFLNAESIIVTKARN